MLGIETAEEPQGTYGGCNILNTKDEVFPL